VSEFDPPKWNLMQSWKYATSNGEVEEEGNPIPQYVDGDAYLLVEKKDYNGTTTYWGTLYGSVTQVVQYTKSLGYTGPGTASDMGWKVVYLFDLNTGEPMYTELAYHKNAEPN
jgi:hypothetical protein